MSTSGTGLLNPLTPIVNLGNLYINGQRLTWLSTTTFSVGAGQVRDSTDTVDIIMGASQYTNSSAESDSNPTSVAVTVSVGVTGAGGIDVSTVTASSMYSVFAIGNSAGFLPGSVVISLVAPNAAPHLPTSVAFNGQTYSYDCYRYIGSVSIDSGSHFRPFMQTGAQALRTIWYDPGTGPSTRGIAIPSSPTTGSTTYVNVGVLTTLVPQAAVECLFDVDIIGSSAGDALWMAPATIDNGTTATVGSFTGVSTVAGTYHELAQLRCPVSLPNATQQAALTIGNVVTALVATTTTDAIVILFSGYVDQL